MSDAIWAHAIPELLPLGTAPGWRISREDQAVRFFWDGSRWSHARVIGQGTPPVDYLIVVVQERALPAEASRRRKRFHVRGAIAVPTVVLVLAVVVAGLVMPAAGHSSQPGLLQVDEAQHVYQDLVPHLSQDLMGPISRLKDLRNFVTPTALQVIVAEAACGCLQIPRYPPLSVELSVPVERTYPLSFLAETDNTLLQGPNGPAYHYIFLTVLEKATPRSTWEITYFTASTAIHPIRTNGTVSGPAPAVSGTIGFLRQLALAMTGARLHGAVPARNVWGDAPPDSNLGAFFSTLVGYYRADVASNSPVGDPYRVTDVTRVFRTSLGTFQCGTIKGDWNDVHPNQIQPPDRSAFGTLLAPGTYESVTTLTTRQACVDDFRGDPLPGLSGLYGGAWRIIGIPQSLATSTA